MALIIEPLATVAFKDIFPKEEKQTIPELLVGIPTSTILTIVAHFMAQIHSKENDFLLQKEILLRWLNQQSQEKRDEIVTKFDELSVKHKNRVSLFNNITSLYFYQSLFSHFNNGDDRDLTADEELRFFKAYLIISEIWTEKEIEHLSQRPSTDDEMVAYVLPFQMTHNEIQSYKDFRVQLLKAIYFFQFIELDDELSSYLPEFLDQYGLSNWKEYLRHTIVPYVLSITGSKSTVLVFDESNKIETDYWDSFCIDIDSYVSKPDFLELRESPVFKISEYNYLFYNYNFIIDKLFQSLQFVFSKLLISKGVVNNFGDFKSKYYSEKFSENYMLYKVVKHCIANQESVVSYDGEELAALIGEKGPDYYIRVNNHVLLIEFKDVLMGAGPKVSYDFSKITKEISRKLVKNEGGKAKGVGQLARFINSFPNGGYAFDQFEGDEIHFYPLMIVTDSAFSLFGINYLLEQELSNLIEVNAKKKIKHLGLLPLDSLLIFQDLLHENRVNFFDILNGYDHDYYSENSLYKFQDLSIYFIDYINHNKIPSRDNPDILRNFIENELIK